MGKIRARTEEELTARRNEILSAAESLLMTEEYDDITLATIAERTSISRTSMYTYYDRKERVFLDLMIREYLNLEQELQAGLSVRMQRQAFCQWLSELLWSHPTLLKLLSLQLSVWDRKYSDDLIEHFVRSSMPYIHTLDRVLAFQFPQSDESARNMFKVQYSVYCNALYGIQNLPRSQMKDMEGAAFSRIPTPQEICRDGLMLLSAVLEV